MSNHKTFFGKLFGWVGDLFHNAAEKLWEDLTPQEQASLKHGSGVIAIVNAHIAEVPQEVINAITQTYPDLDLKGLETALLAWCDTLGIKPPTIDLKGAIASIQAWLKSKEDNKVWQWASSAAAEFITVFLAPSGATFFQKVSMLMQWVYDTIIKGN